MVKLKTLKALEYDKILSSVADFAVLTQTKSQILQEIPATDFSVAEFLLNKTEEAYNLLYKYSVGGMVYFDDVTEELQRVLMGGTLINAEILKVCQNLKSARIVKNAISSVNDSSIKILPNIADRLFINPEFEKEVVDKIISDDEISDHASPKLYQIRKNIRNLNARIRDRLNSYLRGNSGKFLQDGVITMRQDRYVIPVKAEYKNLVKGFVHDQSSSGATVFIEPEAVLELNNELKGAYIDEANEIRRILAELSQKISFMVDGIKYNAENLMEIDCAYAKANYSFYNKCSKPLLNTEGVVDIKRGRHPLIDKNKVVPVSVKLGENYKFILITGPNTGGKTVTLKLVGLLSCMALSGIFIPSDEESKISVFDSLYCDIGDEQSIEQSLSTFSSHMKNIIEMVNSDCKNSLILLDEIGAGTDPEEGSCIALAVIEKLLSSMCYGIITTHYSRLKEYAVESQLIENASMEFDSENLKPLYKLNVGIPGSSNAIEIAKTLGLDKKIISKAIGLLSDKQVSFEKVLKKAEDSRREADRLAQELEQLKSCKKSELDLISEEREKISKQREKIYAMAKAETKRIVADKLAEAEEIIDELKSILKKVGLESKEVFRASELKNRLKNSKYLQKEDDDDPYELIEVNLDLLKEGDRVFVKSLGNYAIVKEIKKAKKEALISVGDIKTVVKIKELFNQQKVETKEDIKVLRQNVKSLPINEINVIGKTSLEATTLLEEFITQAVMHGLEEIKIIHGVGEGILLKTIRNNLKNDKRVEEFRRGKYGEGENGVTIIKLK